uniref:Zinc transporter ZIP9 n=1 Tax=Sphaeramia orbicularis TaxID=375764 RepID=A0A673A051_9TELE
MDGGLTITLISVAMFIGCFLLGFIPLLFRLSETSMKYITILGAGLLCGTALSIIIPEGVGLIVESLTGEEVTIYKYSFVLYVRTVADGFALGAAVATSEVTVQVIVFLAVILHKAPAAFGLVSFLMHSGLEKKYIQGHLLAFSAAAPIVAIITYFILHASGSLFQHSSTGMGMLFSAGTFLYVATVHVLPEIRYPHQHRYLGLLETMTLIFGVALTVVDVGHSHI